MKKLLSKIKKVTNVCTILLMIMCMFSLTVGAEDTVNVNGTQFKVGDTVTYVAEFKCDKICGGINATLTYADSVLEIVENTVNVPNLGLTAANYENLGIIRFAGIDANGFDFSESKVLITVSFKLKGTGDNTISLKIDEIFDNDLAEIDASAYQLTEKISAGVYDGEIVDPNNYENIEGGSSIAVDSFGSANNQANQVNPNNIIIFVTLGAAVAVIVVVAVVYRRKKFRAIKND